MNLSRKLDAVKIFFIQNSFIYASAAPVNDGQKEWPNELNGSMAPTTHLAAVAGIQTTCPTFFYCI